MKRYFVNNPCMGLVISICSNSNHLISLIPHQTASNFRHLLSCGTIGDRGHYDPNVRGLKLIEFANFFNLCPVNLLDNCSGPLETFVSHCGRYKSTIDYIFLPICLSDKSVSCKTLENSIDNTSDHLPIKLQFVIISVFFFSQQQLI